MAEMVWRPLFFGFLQINRFMIAPYRNEQNPWEGHAPWKTHRVEVVIPVIDAMDTLPVVLELLRLQTIRPYLVIIDTGSQPAQWEQLQALRAADLEIHRIASGGMMHASAPVAVALDLGLSICRTPYQILTHQDCFLLRRDAVEALVNQLGPQAPVVGYQITPRTIPAWQTMCGHTWTGLHVPTIRKTSAKWGYNGQRNFDTEYGFFTALAEEGIAPILLGGESNYSRNITADFDHVRSWPSSGLYAPEHRAKSLQWMEEALKDARQRIRAWRNEKL